MKKLLLSMVAVFGLAMAVYLPSDACTSYYVGSDLTKDGSALYGRTEDIGSSYDKVFQVIQPKEIKEGEKWTDGKGFTEFTGDYKTGLTKTYRYTACRDAQEYGPDGGGLFGEVGVNEKGVSMSATTTAGCSKMIAAADPFVGKSGISEENYVDYVLCQAATAEEGVKILGSAIEKYGVWYTADGVFIADKNEVWYMEILSSHQYCAVRMPSDKAAIIPNCLVLGDIDLQSKDVIASDGVVDVAKEAGTYVAAQDPTNTGADINIKLSYVGEGYAMYDSDRIRGGQYLLTGKDNTDIYTAKYQDIFFDLPKDSVTVEKIYELAGTQYEEYGDTDFSAARPTKDDLTAAGLDADSLYYGSIRYIGVASSAECHIMQIRSDMPTELATVEWLSLSSAAYTTFVPFYGAALTDVPASYKVEAADYSDDSAYWTYQSLGAYCRKNPNAAGTAVKDFFKGYMTKLEADQVKVDKEMLAAYNADPSSVSEKATKLADSIGTQTYEMVKKLKAEVENKTVKITTDYKDISYSLEEKKADNKKSDTTPTEKKEETSVSVTKPGRASIRTAKNVKGKKMKVKLAKVKGASGYQIAYSTGVNFGKSKTKTKLVSAKTRTKVVKKLKKGKRYYVKARAYKKVGNKKVYGKWSTIRIVKIAK